MVLMVSGRTLAAELLGGSHNGYPLDIEVVGFVLSEIVSRVELEFLDFLKALSDIMKLMHVVKSKHLRSVQVIPPAVLREIIVADNTGARFKAWDRSCSGAQPGITGSAEQIFRGGISSANVHTRQRPVLCFFFTLPYPHLYLHHPTLSTFAPSSPYPIHICTFFTLPYPHLYLFHPILSTFVPSSSYPIHSCIFFTLPYPYLRLLHPAVSTFVPSSPYPIHICTFVTLPYPHLYLPHPAQPNLHLLYFAISTTVRSLSYLLYRYLSTILASASFLLNWTRRKEQKKKKVGLENDLIEIVGKKTKPLWHAVAMENNIISLA
ncbi:hypothetical protein PoB_003906200 [Plakobranchus ocellatus]|uniref:Uncharacterized protein n=1 Tax=Plakobranchus ocellatus TaxID=259542 RepID=A0AAV4B087_9GAST|nr:hypothetical protein PoB_003906200 [Plakobranchus ocellatus]